MSGIKLYEVEVIAGQRPLAGLVADPNSSFTARCLQEAHSADEAKRKALNDMRNTGVVAWCNVTACRRASDVEVQSEELLKEMLEMMRCAR